MLLAIDAGNTNVVIGAYQGSGASAHLAAQWRIRTDRERTADEHGMLVKDLLNDRGFTFSDIHNIAIASVVPPINASLIEMCKTYFHISPFVVGPETDSGITIHYKPASDVGADRICNAVGAFSRYGGPCIVVDFGTATTFDAIDVNGDYLGGAIVPGIGISMDALFKQAARLFRVELAEPPKSIGQTTVHAMQSGLLFGFAGQTDAMVERFKAELGPNARVVATGGLAEQISSVSRTIELTDPMITLEGLRIITERQ